MYLAVFLCAASVKLLTVSSAKHMDLSPEFHHTMSGRRSVGTMWVGKSYSSSRSTDSVVVGRRCGLIVACRTRSWRMLYRQRSLATSQLFST